ncbi:MAG: twin transmembrane helix small protein [Methylovirgula sp.]|jgi:Hypoxia induced protein conserved region
MHTFGNFLVAAALLAVLFVLFAGVVNMARGGNSNLSQVLMRWRVGLQFLAILIIIGVLFFRR